MSTRSRSRQLVEDRLPSSVAFVRLAALAALALAWLLAASGGAR